MDEAQKDQDVSISDNLKNHLHSQLTLCDALEKVADELPANVDRQECLYIAKNIFPIVKRAHEFEETKLFPILSNSLSQTNVKATLNRLHIEHWEDESYALELQDALTEFAANSPSSNAETLGYMLRSFFGNLRRHIASETELFDTQQMQ